jgi:hypothetical protein
VYIVWDLGTGMGTAPRLLSTLQIAHDQLLSDPGQLIIDRMCCINRHNGTTIVAFTQFPRSMLYYWIISAYDHNPTLSGGRTLDPHLVATKTTLALPHPYGSSSSHFLAGCRDLVAVHQHGVLAVTQSSIYFWLCDHKTGHLSAGMHTYLHRVAAHTILPLPYDEQTYGVVSPYKTRTEVQWQASLKAVTLMIATEGAEGLTLQKWLPYTLPAQDRWSSTSHYDGGALVFRWETDHVNLSHMLQSITLLPRTDGGSADEDENDNKVQSARAYDVRVTLMFEWPCSHVMPIVTVTPLASVWPKINEEFTVVFDDAYRPSAHKPGLLSYHIVRVPLPLWFLLNAPHSIPHSLPLWVGWFSRQ